MPLRAAPCSRARPMACPAQGFFLSLVLSSIAHQLLLSGSLCDLGLQPRLFRGVCFSVRPPAARCRPAEAGANLSRRESLPMVASLFTCFPLRTLESLNSTQAASNPQLSNYIFNMYILMNNIIHSSLNVEPCNPTRTRPEPDPTRPDGSGRVGFRIVGFGSGRV